MEFLIKVDLQIKAHKRVTLDSLEIEPHHQMLFSIITRTTQKCCIWLLTDPGNSTLQNNNCMVTYIPSHKPSKQDMLGIAEKGRTNS